jgi:hypothetical protein
MRRICRFYRDHWWSVACYGAPFGILVAILMRLP